MVAQTVFGHNILTRHLSHLFMISPVMFLFCFFQIKEVSHLCSYFSDESLVFHECAGYEDAKAYRELCMIDLCSCFNQNYTREQCLNMRCGAATQYARMCSNKGVVLQWRTETFCRKYIFFYIHDFKNLLPV